jgi:D-alanine--poly(phosphoribitol) ligase subunit 1
MYDYNLGLRFQQVAKRFAQRPALWFEEGDSIDYAGLNSLANQTARWLLDCGVVNRDVVCISGVKSLATFARMIACLKIGATYSMLDPESPPDRLRRILSSCRPRLVIAGREFLSKAGNVIAELDPTGKADPSRDLINEYDDGNLDITSAVTGADPAYIMFTSGSTGIPKGATITHANVLNLIDWSSSTYSIIPDDVLTNVNPLYFDNSVFDFYSALFNGASLVPFTKTEVNDPKTIVRKVAAAGCTIWFSVPSLLIFLQTMRATDGQNLRSIRRFIFGGEGYPKGKLKQFYELYAASSEFFNVYGPTECTCICSSYRVTAKDFDDLSGFPPLGQMAGNFACLILGDDSRSVQPGEIGELCLLGPNVGKGYYNDAERTAASFIQNPINDKFPEVTYKTGDLVRLDPVDGKIYIQGRRDNQIKHMGYRIELEEIEVALYGLAYVAEAAALHTSINGLSRIIAIVAAREPCDDEQIRRDLGRSLPAYMIPAVFHREEILPKNQNGKVDRLRLAQKYLPAKVKEGMP